MNVERVEIVDRGQLDHLGAELARAGSRSSLACSRARVTTTVGRTAAGARTTRGRARRPSPTTIARRRLDAASAIVASVARTVRCSGRVPQRTAATGVSGGAAAGDRAVGDLADAARAHEDHERAAGPGQRVPVDVGAALGRVLVAGDHGEAGRQAAVGDRDARVGRRGDRGGDAGHDLERDAGAASASASSPPRANTNGSPPLSRTTVEPARPALDEQLR